MSDYSILFWTMFGTCATAVATIGLVVGAFLAWQTAKKSLEHIRDDSARQTRPYVYAKITPSIGGAETWDLIIKNTGNSSAMDLTASVSEWPEDDVLVTAIRELFTRPQTLPPGTSIRTYWSFGPSAMPRSSVPVGFDKPVAVTLTYRGDDPSIPPYSETYRLDSTALGMTPVATSGVNLPNGYSPAEKKLSEIVRAIHELNRGQ